MTRSKVKGQGHQGQERKTAESSPLTHSALSSRRHRSVAAGGDGWRQYTLTAACVRCMFG